MISLASVSNRPAIIPPALPSLTGLRWLAALTVFVYHLRNLGYFGGAEQQWLSAVFGGGSSAVSLFFVLSGFVLAWSDRGTTSFVEAWRNRIVRIYPLHLVGLGLALCVAATVYPGIRTHSSGGLVANLFLVNSWNAAWWQAGNPVSWSLSCEMFFYFLFPFVIRILTGRGTRLVVAVGVASLVLTWTAPFLSAWMIPTVSAYSNPLARLPEFILGVTVGVLMKSHQWRGPRLVLALPILAIGYIMSTAAPDNPLSAAGFTALGSALLIAGLARRDVEGSASWLAFPGMVRLGHASFAFYVVHLLVLEALQGLFPALHAADPLTAAMAAMAALTAATTLGLALHHILEKPLARELRRAPRTDVERMARTGTEDVQGSTRLVT